ncbi:6-phosphogluconolactonase [Arcticibacter sp. MXS-1]|uniref:6-phosphogluconolactonase n=1 Tax=Arcticibacter sp. MXS-1 TaxID=3341726 RepID=UPI0035A8EB84
MIVERFSDKADLFRRAAGMFVDSATRAIAKKGFFSVALTGGNSPRGLHELLSLPEYSDQIEWDKVLVFWGDERWVPLSDQRSNARMAFESLLDRVNIPASNIFPMYSGSASPEEFAKYYDELLAERLGEERKFDLIFLGMGPDGHTASIFPGSPVVHDHSKAVKTFFLKEQDMYRITLTAPLINGADSVIFMVFGEDKAHALKEVLYGELNPDLYPAQLIRESKGEVHWLVDEAASAQIQTQE